MGVHEVRYQAQGKVSACGIASHGDILGMFAEAGQDVVEDFCGLAQLSGVCGLRSEGVGRGQNRK